MDEDVRKRWLVALRSGDYAQGKGTLCRRQIGANGSEIFSSNRRYCCLGVLADILGELRFSSNLGPGFTQGETYEYLADGYKYTPTSTTGLVGEIADRIGISDDEQQELARQNDSGKTFLEIANYIEENL